MTAPLKRGLSLSALALVIGLVSCTTVAPSVALTGPAGPYIVNTPVTLTATGSPGSGAGLWTYSFSASPACGTFAPATIGPTNLTTVTTQFTPTTQTVNCTLSVTLTTASGRTATASITRTVAAHPIVTSTVPANSTSNVSVTSEISVTFDQAMDPATLVLSCTGEAAGPGHGGPFGACNMTIGSPTGGPTTFTWAVGDPDASPTTNLQFNRAYQMQVTGSSALGLAMAAPFVWAFATEVAPLPPPPSLPACAIVSLTDSVGSGATDNFGPMAGATAGNQAWGYVQGPSDSILRLMAAATGTPSNCPGGSIACDDDDGASYTPTSPAVLPGTITSVSVFNSLLGNAAMTASTNVWTVNGFGGGAMANYNFFGHFTNTDFTETEPNGTIATANNVPAVPNWRIGGSITAGDVDYFAFTAAVNDVIFVVVAPDPSFDSVIQLRSSTDTLLVSVDGGFSVDPEGYAVRLTAGGTYYIRVHHFSSTGTGSYRLTACKQ